MRTGRGNKPKKRLPERTSDLNPAVWVKKALWRLSPRHEVVKMIAGAGVGIAGGGTAMLRTRRKDISIKLNRKLDRKSSRGMLYENEELRLRTININAEVEQGQNDIKKLRRENEQLRREIWSLRDEYDKLEEILKKQKNRDESDDLEDRSGDETNISEYWDEEEEEEEGEEGEEEENLDNEEDVEDEESDSEESSEEDCNKEERLENAENQKISSEKMSNNGPMPHRSRINFDDLSIVDEEEEPKKQNADKKIDSEQARQALPDQTNQFPYQGIPFDKTDPLAASNFPCQSDCAFAFPSAGPSAGYSAIMPTDRNCLLMRNCPQVYPEASIASSQRLIIPPLTLPPPPNRNMSQDPGRKQLGHPSHVVTGPPPPPGWQSNGIIPLPAPTSPPMSASKFPLVNKQQTDFAKETTLWAPEAVGLRLLPVVISKPTDVASLAERRKAFFKQRGDSLRDIPPVNDGSSRRATDNDCIHELRKKIEEVDADCQSTRKASLLSLDGSKSADNAPRHFFAPLPGSPRFPYLGDSPVKSTEETGQTARYSDDRTNSPGSERTCSTLLSRSRFNDDKGSADICVSGAVSYNEANPIEKGDAKAFFSSENLFIDEEPLSNETGNPLSKSISCQDLSTRLSFDGSLKFSSDDHNHAKSDNTLDSIALGSKAYRSQLNVTLKRCKSPSPDVPEIPKLPSIDYKLFNNPFLQNFEQAYQNFPVRSEGQSPVTHPLSIQVSESPVSGTKYSSPVRVQASFTGPSTSESDCGTCKRKNLEQRLRLMIPSAKILNKKTGDGGEYQVTSFETPSPRTVQIPTMASYNIETIRRLPTTTTTTTTTTTAAAPTSCSPAAQQQNSRLYQNVPFVPRGAAVYCPGQGMRMYYDTVAMKVPAQTQTSVEEETTPGTAEISDPKPVASLEEGGSQPASELPKKRRSRKEKPGSAKDKRKSQGSQKRKDQLTKQGSSVVSKEASESPGKSVAKTRLGEIQDDKNESRSSSSGQESPKKEQTKRVSLYFSAKKRPSLSSGRTSRSRSVENTKERILTRDEMLEGNTTNSERERTNSISSREVGQREKIRKPSTSSGNVPWCACWGNGCI